MLKEFKKFALRGNMIDLAVGVIIGGAFNGIVTSLVNDIIMPILSIFTGSLDFSNWFIAVDGQPYENIQAAQAANVATINYGVFITGVLNFLIMAFVIFIMVRQMNKLREKNAPVVEPTTKKCPHCLSEINIKATKCPFCTSDVE
ncbi:large conductance mechanosensitive channel protein MscL [Anaerocolumna sp.]|uniref:large conductance mechanosensitive channel protein MscL n=1 Tax=Anaerocolumna sp. TaxID=2041569 RepID=UPI0028AD51DA|nr:large conductance mechanosensitive channel protein MscL [Anaerocolumna sp.]